MANDQELAIVCFAGNDWWYHNRGLFCPQVMTRLSRDFLVLFVNSLGMRVPSLKNDKYALKKIARKIRSISRFLRKSQEGMIIVSPLSLPISGNRIGRAINSYSVYAQIKILMTLYGIKRPVFYVNCPPALDVVKRFGRCCLIYERTDLFAEMPGINRDYIKSLDTELLRTSDLVLYVDEAMYKEGAKQNLNSLLIGHGVDFPRFADERLYNTIPKDLANIPKPIVGYFGDICDKTFDFALMEQLAKALMWVSFVLIGPLSSDVGCLRKYKNVHILGQKPYEEIPRYGAHFDVSILPWKTNQWVMHSYPIKIKEYLALGNPFVSIDIPAVDSFRDVIYVASSYDDFVKQVRLALQDKDSKARSTRKESVRNETWDSKAEQIREFILQNAESDSVKE